MLVSLEGSEGLERRLKIQVPAENVEKAVDTRLRSVGKGAKLKGFRPGKAPIKVIRQHYGDQVRREVLGEILQSSYQEAITQEKLNPAGGPKIEPDVMEPGKDLEYTAVIEVYPEIDLGSVSGIKVERPSAEVTDEDLDRMLDNLRKQKMEWAEVERGAKEGDQVTIDFAGTIDGEAFEGGTAEGVTVVLGNQQMIADFEAGLDGLKAGDQKDIDVTFPEDYHSTDLAGKAGVFAVTLHKVEEGTLPEIDEEFCKSYGVETGSLDELKKEVRANMTREMSEVIRRIVRQQLIEQSTQAAEFEIPGTLVEEEINRMIQEMMQRQPKDAPAPPREAFNPEAQRRVQLGLLISEVIRSEKMELDNDRVREKVLELAGGYEQPEELVRSYMSNPQIMQQLEGVVLEDQAFDWLLDKAEVTDVEKSFKELMNFNN